MFAKEFRKFIQLTALVLAALILAALPAAAGGPVASDQGVTFSLSAPDAQAVFLAGDFNGWNAEDLALGKGGDGNWSVTITLDPGTFEYKFVVDGQWVEDAGNAQRNSDPFGGFNSVVTVNADGSLAGTVAAASAAAAPTTSAASAKNIKVGRPQAVDGGVAFSFKDKGATRVTLAGTFNGWNAEDLPLATDGQGNWTIVKQLEPGQHEYKFVVDGNWLADPENPDTVSDPYGGVNSVVNLDDKSQLVAAPQAESVPLSNNTLNAKVAIDGRYLTRFEYAKNVPVDVNDETKIDPRYRLQRPTQSVDLNFQSEVSDVARTFMRLRLDSDQNIIQNNVAAFLDEANLALNPAQFDMTTYWNQEIFTGEDLLRLGGDIDLPGTILHDHLNYGKGSAGALFEADPWGIHTRLFFANVHNFDYYNDPDLFDNLGQDKLSLRFSRKFGNFEIGTPLYAERSLVWLNFEDLVSQASTGIPVLDTHRANTGDSSTWFETDSYQLNSGVDVRYEASDRWAFGAEALYRKGTQRFVTGNQTSPDKTNGAMDLPFLQRDEWVYVGQATFKPNAANQVSLRHIATTMSGSTPDDRLLTYSFQPQATANKKVFFSIGASPATADLDSTELTWQWSGDNSQATLWLRRAGRSVDFSPVNRQAPEDSTVTSYSEEIWYLAGSAATGRSEDKYGHFELEAGLNLADRGVAGLKDSQLEMIFRYDRNLTRNTGLIADLRFVKYHIEGHADGTNGATTDTDFFSPFLGVRYTPISQLKLVVAYGVDPVDYSIDYQGRQLGRWMFRQNYLFDHPGATNLEAENFLKNARVITLRAQLLF